MKHGHNQLHDKKVASAESCTSFCDKGTFLQTTFSVAVVSAWSAQTTQNQTQFMQKVPSVKSRTPLGKAHSSQIPNSITHQVLMDYLLLWVSELVKLLK